MRGCVVRFDDAENGDIDSPSELLLVGLISK